MNKFPSDAHDVVMLTRTSVEVLVFVAFILLSPKIFWLRTLPQLEGLKLGVTSALISSIVFLALTIHHRYQNRPIKNITYFESIADAFLIIWLIFIFGGMNGPFFFFFFLALMESAFTLNPLVVFAVVLMGLVGLLGDFGLQIYSERLSLNPYFLFLLFFRILTTGLIGYYSYSFLQSVVKEKRTTDELKVLTKKLEEANIQIQSVEKMKSDLLNMASHEFRTPAGIIKNSIWFLNKDEEKKDFSDKAQQNLERMIDASERLDYILDNIEKMLETTAGDFKLDLSPVQLEILIKEVVEGKYLESQEKQVEVKFEEPKKLLPTINADATKLKYVFWELLTNALKYTNAGGAATISAAQKDGLVEVKVADTGCGIPKERLENIFEGFAKPDIIHTHQAGMGLGLHIVKKIVDLHNGQIKIESKVDHGTTVTITLPV